MNTGWTNVDTGYWLLDIGQEIHEDLAEKINVKKTFYFFRVTKRREMG